MNKYLLKELEEFGIENESLEDLLEDKLFNEYLKTNSLPIYWRNRFLRNSYTLSKELKKIKKRIKSLKLEDLQQLDIKELDISSFFKELKTIEDFIWSFSSKFSALNNINPMYFQLFKNTKENGNSSIEIFNERVEKIHGWIRGMIFELEGFQYNIIKTEDIDPENVNQFTNEINKFHEFFSGIDIQLSEVERKFNILKTI